MSLVQGDRSVYEHKAEFLRLNQYAQTLVATEYDKCVCFKDELRYRSSPISSLEGASLGCSDR